MKMNREYYFKMFYYLSEAEARRRYYKELSREHRQEQLDTLNQITERALYELLRYPEQRDRTEVMSELAELLRKAGMLSESRFAQYLIIEEEVQRHPCIQTADLFCFLDRIADRNPMSEPAYGVLYDHYGEIIRVMMADYDPIDGDKPLDEDKLLRILSDFIMCDLKPDQIEMKKPGEDPIIPDSVWRTFTDDTPEDDDEVENEENVETEDEFEYMVDANELLHNFLITVPNTELERYSAKKDAIYISPTLFEDDEVFIEDLVTFANYDHSRGVTFQIIGQACMNAEDFNCFFESLKDEEGNNSHQDMDFGEMDLDSSHSYKILRLPYPVLSEEDLKRYKTYDPVGGQI